MPGPTAVSHNQIWLTLLVNWVLYSSGLVEWHMTQVFEITKFFQCRFKPLCCEINTEIQCFKIIIMAGISSRKSKIQCKGRKPSWLNSRVYLGVFQQNWPLNHKKYTSGLISQSYCSWTIKDNTRLTKEMVLFDSTATGLCEWNFPMHIAYTSDATLTLSLSLSKISEHKILHQVHILSIWKKEFKEWTDN